MSQEQIVQSREAFGPPPRRFKPQEIALLQVPPPVWLPGDNRREPHELFRALPWVFTEGNVRWGAIVQANQLCWEEGPIDSPACVIHSSDPYFDDHLEELHEIGHGLYETKGKDTRNRELQRFADMLENELDAQMRLPVPRFLTGGREVTYTTLFVFRRHLPVPYLIEPVIPIVSHPNTGHSAILPSIWWAPSLVQEWLDQA